MRAIPAKIRRELESDPWMKQCKFPNCTSTNIEWHHATSYQGRQVNEKWAIIPLCKKHHDSQEGKYRSELMAICRMTDKDKEKYYKRDWEQRKAELKFNIGRCK